MLVVGIRGEIWNVQRIQGTKVLVWREKAKIVEVPGFEPGAFRMQSECDTTTPHPQRVITFSFIKVKANLSAAHFLES